MKEVILYMTKEEFSEKFGYSLATLKTSFKRTQEAMRNKGYIVTRTGSWPNPNYEVQYDASLIPKKEITLHTELIGKRYGHLVVLRDTGERKFRSIVWECQCDCGNLHKVSTNHLTAGTQSCGKETCQYSRRYKDLTNQKFGMLTALYPTIMKDGSHMYWMCKCDCGNSELKEVSSSHLTRGNVQSCGCIKTSIGERNIEAILIQNNLCYQTQVAFKDLVNIKPLRFDFGLYNQKGEIIRLIEFDGIQHFEEQDYFTHNLEETQKNDMIKNNYAKANNIPLVRIPYYERDKITLEMILGDKYLCQ